MPDVTPTSPTLPSSVLPGGSWIDRVDPRARILAAVAFSLLVAVANRLPVATVALGVAAGAVLAAGLRPRTVLSRLVPLNVLMLLLALLLPLSAPGEPLFAWGPIHYSAAGLWQALGIAVKGNAIVLALVLLVGTLEIAALGHALSHLWVPRKLIHLLLFTVRYLDVLGRQYARLAAAMKMRAFRPRMSRHTYRTYGHLVGMLLVRSLDRSERIVAAMKCRGFRGRFYLLDHFAYARNDAWFAAATLALLCGLAWAEWGW
jgi:cobalt/nickel transport system permease protein